MKRSVLLTVAVLSALALAVGTAPLVTTLETAHAEKCENSVCVIDKSKTTGCKVKVNNNNGFVFC